MELTETNSLGGIHISQHVLAAIASQAAAAVPGVCSLGATLKETAVQKLIKAEAPQGVDVSLDGRHLELTVRLIVQYGRRIPDIALAVQTGVKEAVERYTGYPVSAVHVIIQDIDFSADAQQT